MAEPTSEPKAAQLSRKAIASVFLGIGVLVSSLSAGSGNYVAIALCLLLSFGTLVLAVWGGVNIWLSKRALRGRSLVEHAIALVIIGLLVGFFLSAMAHGNIRTVSRSASNLIRIGTAFHNYWTVYQQFPKDITDENNQPLLSWRVELLPYVKADAIHKKFRLNESWDSEHNKKLLSQMPSAYASPADDSLEPGHTFYQALIGPGTAFSAKGFEDFGRPINSAILLAEAWTPVPWTKPADIVYDPNGPLPSLGGIFKPLKWYEQGIHRKAGANILFLDNHIQFLSPKEMREETLRLLLAPPSLNTPEERFEQR